MRILCLDDMRDPSDYIGKTHGFGHLIYWLNTYDDFVSWVDDHHKDLPDIIYFDHDLGTEKTGYDAAKYLLNFCIENGDRLPEIHSQSSNPPGRENILSITKSYKKYKDLCTPIQTSKE